ncbi:glycosyltransferase [Enterococcus hermanniensis]|uniref:Glycosyl transferase family 2 n=1 Tax=Enterococcus hermanniensis TaxID=249189 RepID=A0A1L8TLM1_9ENTE|nr:glycosyltransferase [Enterococcus hermanniensis]OJG45058.1 glycosyl transferase family 2 [Enterococcus hermanniensis]
MVTTKTSVVMATYNGEKNILQQLESLKNQTKHVDEVLIRDDCSTDSTVEIIQNYIEKNNLIDTWTLELNKQNVGWRKNFIELLKSAKGDIIFTSDQDDEWNPSKIEIMANIFTNNQKVKVLVSDYTELVEKGGLAEKLKKIDTVKSTNKEELVVFNANNIYLRRPGCVYAVRKNFIPNVLEYIEGTKNPVHDQAMWGSGILSDGLYVIHENLISWRKHGLSSFKKEIDKSEKNTPYIKRLNDLKRRYDRLTGALNYLKRNQFVLNYDLKEKFLIDSLEELNMRISILSKKQFNLIIKAFFKYKTKFYFFSDILHLYKFNSSFKQFK